MTRWRYLPRDGCLFLRGRDENSNNAAGRLGFLKDVLDCRSINSLDCRQECPLIRIGYEVRVEKRRISVIARLPLQRQSNQITETALWERILIGKKRS